MNIEITYCMAWNYQPDADRVSAEIKEATGEDASLVPSSGGIFDVKVDGNLVFSKHKVARFPQPGEISQLLAEWVNLPLLMLSSSFSVFDQVMLRINRAH